MMEMRVLLLFNNMCIDRESVRVIYHPQKPTMFYGTKVKHFNVTFCGVAIQANLPLKFSIKSAHCQWERDVFNIGLGLKNVARDIVTVVDQNVEREIVLVVLTSNLRNSAYIILEGLH